MNTPYIPELKTCSLKDLQRFNNAVYRVVNDRNFEILEMLCRLLRYAGRVCLRVQKEETERTPYHLCMMLSWVLAIANRLSLYAHEDVDFFRKTKIPDNSPFSELQTLFAKRHQDTTIDKAALCLIRKVADLGSALEYYRETHEYCHFRDAAQRIAEIIEALTVVSSPLGVNLAEAFEENFKHGCATCHTIPCKCGFRADKVV